MAQWRFSGLTLIILTTMLIDNSAGAKPLQLLPESTKTEFVGIGKPALLKVKGFTKEMSAVLDLTDGTASGEFKVPLKNLDSGIELRDDHMKNKYLAIGQFPDATLKIDALKIDTLKTGSQGEKLRNTIPFSGAFTLHGVTKQINGDAEIENRSAHYTVTAKLNIKLSDYGIEIPRYSGITFADNVDIKVQFEAETK